MPPEDLAVQVAAEEDDHQMRVGEGAAQQRRHRDLHEGARRAAGVQAQIVGAARHRRRAHAQRKEGRENEEHVVVGAADDVRATGHRRGFHQQRVASA
jgi:hypothetical protein